MRRTMNVRLTRVTTAAAVILLSGVAFGGAAMHVNAAPPFLPTLSPIPSPVPNPPERTQVPGPLSAPTVPAIASLPPLPQPTATPIASDAPLLQLWYRAGVAYRDSNAGSQDVVARIGGLDVKRKDVEFLKTLNAGSNVSSPAKLPTDNHGVLMSMVRAKALGGAAGARGLLPTDTDVDNYIRDLRAKFHSTPETALELGSFLSGLGESEDQYFSSADVRATYRRELAVTRLRDQVLLGVSTNQQSDAWDAFARQTELSATVTILDSTFK